MLDSLKQKDNQDGFSLGIANESQWVTPQDNLWPKTFKVKENESGETLHLNFQFGKKDGIYLTPHKAKMWDKGGLMWGAVQERNLLRGRAENCLYSVDIFLHLRLKHRAINLAITSFRRGNSYCLGGKDFLELSC